MSRLENLNEAQIKAVTTNKQFVRVIAGAGSGKTRVLTERIIYLVEEIGVPSDRIVAFTFTNKAAQEMFSRVKSVLDENNTKTRLSTFHAFGVRFLRSEIHNIHFSPGFIIYDDEDTLTLIRNICVERGHERRGDVSKSAIHYISKHKGDGKEVSEMKPRKGGAFNEKELIAIWQEYEDRKAKSGALDFDDLLNLTIKILEEFPKVRSRWQDKFDHLLVDEFQDTNDVQYRFLKLFLRKDASLYVVGDPDQTIYTWRGANEKIILDFAKEFDTETIILDKNYRSTQHILNAANRLINFNKDRVKKNLETDNGDGEPVTLYRLGTSDGEASWIYRQINLLQMNTIGFNLRDVVILLRANHLTLPFEKFFVRNNIPYRIYGGIKFYQRREVKDVLAYMRLLLNSRDDVSFERICNVPRRGVGKVALDEIKIAALKNELSLLEVIESVENLSLPAKPYLALQNLVNVINITREKLTNDKYKIHPLMNEYITKVGYFDFIDSEKDEDKQETMRDNVHTLLRDLSDFLEKDSSATLQDYLENTALLSAQDEVQSGEYITLMTVHMAKGLEYDYVFVAGLNDGVFPNQRALSEGGVKALEEERRLCYVAFTRARKRLYVTTTTQYNFVTETAGSMSRFIREAGLKLPEFKRYDERYGVPVYSKQTQARPQEHSYYEEDTDYDYEEDFPYMVNDIVYHKTFGSGVVVAIFPSQTIVNINFEKHGLKRLVATHPSLSKGESDDE